MTFAPIDGAVCILQPGQRPVRLSPTSVLELLDLFFREGADAVHEALLSAWKELQETSQ
mgnify:FL=1